MNPIVYFDMDGVLADFSGGALKHHGIEFPFIDLTWDFPKQIGFDSTYAPEFWKPLENAEFWANLEPHVDGMNLLSHLEFSNPKMEISILSSSSVRGSTDGKRDWLAKHAPKYKDCAIFSTKKYRVSAPCKILVDDNDDNCRLFEESGGKSVLIPRPWNKRRDWIVDRGPQYYFPFFAVLIEIEQKYEQITQECSSNSA